MKKLIDIIIAASVGLLILIVGMTRFHHHISDEKVCFCVDFITDVECCHHHHNNADTHGSPLGDKSENSCPLHIDLFNISEYHDHLHISHTLCCNHHCDICSPEIYAPDYAVVNLYILLPLPLFEHDGYDSVLSRRGPPAFIA